MSTDVPSANLPDDAEAKVPEIPEAKAVDPSTKKTNWADKAKTVEKFWEQAKAYWSFFDGQGQRSKFLERIETSDAMYRLAKNQTKQDDNKTRDAVDCIPVEYFDMIRTITANEVSALFPPKELGVKYEPLDSIDSVARAEAKRVADSQNMVLEHSFVVDERIPKLKDAIWTLNKNANIVAFMEWHSEERTFSTRLPKKGPDGTIELRWTKVTETKEHPTFSVREVKDVWFDCSIPDLEGGQCVLVRSQDLIGNLAAGQKRGEYMNVEDAGKAHMWPGESPDDTVGTRQENADEDTDQHQPSGAFERWDIFLRAPINDKGKWDEKKTLPKWYWGVFLGPITLADPLAVKLIELPYIDSEGAGDLPMKLIHSHRDDKGALHMGYVDVAEPYWHEMKTAMDQWFDAKNTQMAAPMKTEEGAILNDDKAFNPRKLFIMRPGSFDKLDRLRIDMQTGDMLQFMNFLALKQDLIAGTNKPFRGIALGGRTSSAEAQMVSNQAMKPYEDKLDYVANQLFPWIAKKDRAYWRQFADKDHVVAITRDPTGNSLEIKPARLAGPLRVKVTAITSYLSNATLKAEEDRFLSVVLPLMPTIAGREGTANCLKDIYQRRGFSTDDWFPVSKDEDARHVARSENVGFMNGIWDEPKPQENDEIHLQEHNRFLAMYELMPQESQNPETLRITKAHIQIHENLMEQEQQSLPALGGGAPQPGVPQPGGGVPGMGTGETPPMTEGQVAQDLLGAEGGAMAI